MLSITGSARDRIAATAARQMVANPTYKNAYEIDMMHTVDQHAFMKIQEAVVNSSDK